jgi:tellurite resistance protein TerB
MQGTVAVCARIAVASDGVSAEEKQKMIGFLRASEELKVFETTEVIDFSTNW